jgi:hypothetical protein
LYELGIQLIVWISVSKVAGDDDNDAKTKSMQKQNRILKLAVCVFAGLLLGYFIFNSPNVPSLDTGEEIVEMSKQRTSKKITPSRVITPTRVSALDTGTVSDWVNANSDTRLSTAIVWVKELKKERGGRNLEPITHDKSGKENAIALMNLLSAVSATSEGYGDWSKTDLQNAQELIECINYQIKTKYMGTTYMYDPIRDVLFICDISKKQGLH